MNNLTLTTLIKWTKKRKKYQNEWPSEWRRVWYLTVSDEIFALVRTANFNSEWHEHEEQRFVVPGVERGAVCDRIEDKELLNAFINSAAPGQRNAFELNKILPKDATLKDLPVERFLQMLAIAVAPKTAVEFTSKWVAYMEEYVTVSHFNALGKVSDYNMHVKYSAFESFLLELELSYDVLEELADKCAAHGLRIEYPDFKGNFGTFEAMDLIVYKSDNYVLQQVYQTTKKDPSVVVEDPAYAGNEAEGRERDRNDRRLSGLKSRRKEQLR